jgi:hypothetical protein
MDKYDIEVEEHYCTECGVKIIKRNSSSRRGICPGRCKHCYRNSKSCYINWGDKQEEVNINSAKVSSALYERTDKFIIHQLKVNYNYKYGYSGAEFTDEDIKIKRLMNTLKGRMKRMKYNSERSLIRKNKSKKKCSY